MFLIVLSLFLCQSQLNSGHYIPEYKNNKEASHLIQINDQNLPAIRIKKNYKAPPKLTEIVYYHIIEKPFIDDDNKEMKEHNIKSLNENGRVFTNGHGGYQDEELENWEKPSEDDRKVFIDKTEAEETEPYFRDITEQREIEEQQNYDNIPILQGEEADKIKQDILNFLQIHNLKLDDIFKLQAEKKRERQRNENRETAAENEDEIAEIINYDDDDAEEMKTDDKTVQTNESTSKTERGDIEDSLSEESASTEEYLVFTDDANTNPIDANILEKKIQERNQLFNNVRHKYKKIVAHDRLMRRKREINVEDIPEAPVLPQMDFSILPEPIREQVETAMTADHDSHKTETQNESEEKPHIEKENDFAQNDRDNFEENFDKLFDEFFADLHLDGNDSKENSQIHEEIKHSNEHIDKENEVIEENHFNIDYVANFEEEHRSPRTYGMDIHGDNGYVWNDLLSNPGIYFDVGEDADKHEHVVVEALTEEPEITETHPDLQDIHVNIAYTHKRPAHIEIPENTDHSNERVNENVRSINIAEGSSDHNDDNPKTNEVQLEDGEGKREYLKNYGKDQDIDVRVGFDDDVSQIDRGEGKSEAIENILKDDALWKWLAEWADNHKDLLTKYIMKVVKEHDNNKNTLAGGEIRVNENKREDSKEGNKTTELVNKTEDTIDTAKVPTIEEGKLIIDGEEIPITHTTNFKDEDETEGVGPSLKRRNDKDNNTIHSRPSNDRKDKETSNIKAMNIYGNSMNNEKVTNVYVFIKNLDTKGIEALKPLINGDSDKKPDTLVIGNNDKVDVSTNTDSTFEEKVTVTPNPEEISTKPTENSKIETTTGFSTTTEANIQSNVPVDNKVEENTTENSKETTIIDKEILEPQKSEETQSTSESNTGSTTQVPGGNENEEDTPKETQDTTLEHHNSEDADKKDIIENKTESTPKESDKIVENGNADENKLPGPQKTEEVESPTTITDVEASTKKGETEIDKVESVK